MISLLDFMANALLNKLPQNFDITREKPRYINDVHQQLTITRKITFNNKTLINGYATIIFRNNNLESMNLSNAADDPINMQSIQEITEWEQVLHSIREVLFAYEDYQKAYNQNNQ